MPRQPDRIGIIFVHGIGEQRRFEHLDTEVRPLIDALLRRKSNHTIEISAGGEAQLRADQDTWTTQPVRAVVHESGRNTKIHFHEVWWADVNEPYSFMKEIRFWLWGLSIWNFPNQPRDLPGQRAMVCPEFPKRLGGDQDRVARRRLFAACNLFLMGGITLGVWTVLARRLLNLGTFKPVRIFVNYVSSVKLYVQSSRSDGGFLDAYGEPPRVSIRRRMVRTLTDVAQAKYDRWYVFAHSLGSVVAYNGVMENAQALANYLDEKRWHSLVDDGFAGCGRKGRKNAEIDVVARPEELTKSFPARPVWLPSDGVVYRDKLFKNFRGLLTYGSPLDKFAAIWPDRVPINVKEKVFGADAEWINVYDPTDPVAADLDAFSPKNTDLTPRNYGYAAFWAVLYSHLRYLTGAKGRTDRLSDRLIEWVLSGNPFSLPEQPSHWLWFQPGSPMHRLRRLLMRVEALVVYIALTWLGTLFI